MTAPLILALDVSKSRTGIALGRVGEPPRFSSLKCSEHDDDGALAKLGVWLIKELNGSKPDIVFYEAAIQRGVFEAPILKDLVAVVRFVCRSKSIRARPANVQTARAAFLGNGRPDQPKRKAFAMCRMLGWNPSNQDEGDAGCIWYFACLQVAAKHAQYVTPMMQAKVAEDVDHGPAYREVRA